MGAQKFADLMNERTNGRIQTKLYPSNQLGKGEREMTEGIQQGGIDLLVTSTGPLGGFGPSINILDFPFLFRDFKHVDLVLDGVVVEDVRLMIFDKDGTLMDLYYYWSQMIVLRAELICRKLGLGEEQRDRLTYQMGVDVKAGRLRPEGPVGLKSREVVLQTAIDYLASTGHAGSHDLCFAVFEEVDRISSLDLKRFIKPIAGAADLIDSLSAKGCRIAIATTDRTARGKLAMKFLGFADRIDLVVGGDLVGNTKPDPEMVRLILDSLKVDRSNAVMVGDAVTDVRMGVNAGLRASVGVLSGLAGKSELCAITRHVVKSVAEIGVRN